MKRTQRVKNGKQQRQLFSFWPLPFYLPSSPAFNSPFAVNQGESECSISRQENREKLFSTQRAEYVQETWTARHRTANPKNCIPSEIHQNNREGTDTKNQPSNCFICNLLFSIIYLHVSKTTSMFYCSSCLLPEDAVKWANFWMCCPLGSRRWA